MKRATAAAERRLRRPALLGVSEVAAREGVPPDTISLWLHRGSHGIPAPDVRLACGPVWYADGAMRTWLARER